MAGRNGPKAERAGTAFGCYPWGSVGLSTKQVAKGTDSDGGLGQGVPQIDRILPFSLGHQKKATPLTDADHVGPPRTVYIMVSSIGSRWY